MPSAFRGWFPHFAIQQSSTKFLRRSTSLFMVLRVIARALFVTVALSLFAIPAIAQSSEARPRVVTQTVDLNEATSAPEALVNVPQATAASVTNPKPATKPVIDLDATTQPVVSGFLKFQPQLLAAIDERLGSRYSWGAEGPRAFDCSGFVWSIFQSVGITFERGSARTLFSRFTPAAPEEQYKFGTLVFFSGLSHVGVVADENGFYHASRHHGVIYSPFNDYWTKRIDGFRRVPLPTAAVTD
jgi:peptidoglycan endopeptidase LytE